MPYIEVPIEGSGDQADPYRARMNGVNHSAVIPSNADGSPKQNSAIVWVPDQHDNEIDRGIRRIPRNEARDLIRQLDPRVNPDAVEQKRRANIQQPRNR